MIRSENGLTHFFETTRTITPSFSSKKDCGNVHFLFYREFILSFAKVKKRSQFCNRFSVLRVFFFHKLASHKYAHSRRHHESARPSGRVTETVKSVNTRVEVFISLYPVAVELELG